jgi:YD repeat-containing protein
VPPDFQDDFDPYGKMTSVATTSGPSETFEVIGTTNRITLPAPVALAQYDASGNLTSWSDPPTTATYTWDRFNRLTHWGNGAEGWSYVYTADDERLWAIKDVAGATHSNWTFRGLGNEVLVRDERRPSPTPRTLTQYAYREGKLLVSLELGGAFRDPCRRGAANRFPETLDPIPQDLLAFERSSDCFRAPGPRNRS